MIDDARVSRLKTQGYLMMHEAEGLTHSRLTSKSEGMKSHSGQNQIEEWKRGMRDGKPSKAFPFCTTFLAPATSTVTASTTITTYSVISGSSSPNIISLPTGVTASGVSNSSRPTITSAPPFQNTTSTALISDPTYLTPCSSATRVSSACSCLLTTQAPAVTTTVAAATVTIPVCDPAANNGINYVRGDASDLINISQQFPDTSDAHECCSSCFRTPGCLTYSLATVGSIGGSCNLSVAAEGSIRGPLISDTCPFGVYEAYNGRNRSEVGLGPCVDYRGR
ncbi:MAG: hypothetical protein Q9174_002403 [Haloplaca sp. 1 TL-2023]